MGLVRRRPEVNLGQRPRDYRVSWHLLFTVLAIGLFLGATLWQSSNPTLVQIEPVAPNGVALIDELSQTYADSAFVEQVKTLVESAGFWFQYYPPGEVKVPLFWALPALGYEVVIIRAHSTGWFPGDKITIFTGEKYERGKYYWERAGGLILSASTFENGKEYFTVTPKFISSASLGRFPGTVIVFMGCTGLVNDQLAAAFIGKGASAFVGWDEQVYASRTDAATLSFVSALFQERMPVEEAVSYAMSQVGGDPFFNSRLDFYPDAAGSVTVN